MLLRSLRGILGQSLPIWRTTAVRQEQDIPRCPLRLLRSWGKTIAISKQFYSSPISLAGAKFGNALRKTLAPKISRAVTQRLPSPIEKPRSNPRPGSNHREVSCITTLVVVDGKVRGGLAQSLRPVPVRLNYSSPAETRDGAALNACPPLQCSHTVSPTRRLCRHGTRHCKLRMLIPHLPVVA